MAFDPKMTIIHCRRCYRCSFILICFLLLHYLSVIGLSRFQITFSPLSKFAQWSFPFIVFCFVEVFPILTIAWSMEAHHVRFICTRNGPIPSLLGTKCDQIAHSGPSLSDVRRPHDPRPKTLSRARRASRFLSLSFFHFISFFHSISRPRHTHTHTHTHTTSFIDCVRLSPYYHRLDIRNLLWLCNLTIYLLSRCCQWIPLNE